MAFAGGDTIVSPDLFAQNYFTDKIPLIWTSGFDNYVLEFSTFSDFSDSSQIYSGPLFNYTHTGRSADTVGYYRIKGTLNGITSDWQTASFSTMFTTLAAYHLGGLPNLNEDNVFGTVDASNLITVLKSFLGGPDLIPNAGPSLGLNLYENKTSWGTGNLGNSGWCNFSSDLNFGAGDFTIMFEMKFGTSLFPNNYVFSGLAGTASGIYLSNNNIYVRINSSLSSAMAFPGGGIKLSNWNRFVIQNNGGNIRASCDGGLTWSNTVTRPGGSNSFILQRWGANMLGGNQIQGRFISLCFSTQALSDNQMQRWWNIGSGESSNFNNPNLNLPIKNLPATFEPDLVNNYASFVLGIVEKGNGDNIFSIGNENLILVQKKETAPEYNDHYLFAFNVVSGKLRTPIALGHYATTGDVHEKGGMNVIGNSVFISQFSQHYGAKNTRLYIRNFAKDFNLMGLVTLPANREISSKSFITNNQYACLGRIGNNLFSITSQFDGDVGGSGTNGKILLFKSPDKGQSGTLIPMMDGGGSNNWLYAGFIYTDPLGDNYLYGAWEHYSLTATKTVGVGLFKIHADGETISNISGSFTKNINTSGPVTLTELYANFVTVDARTLTCTGNAAFPMCQSNGVIYGVAGNGNNDGYTLWRQAAGGSMITASIGSTLESDNIVVNLLSSYSGTYASSFHRHPIALLFNGTSWDLVALQINGGNWTPTLYRSIDNWGSWSKVGILNGIDTGGQHTELQFSTSYHFNQNKGIFHCSKATSASLSVMYIRNANSLV